MKKKKTTDNLVDALSGFYEQVWLNIAKQQSVWSELIFGKIVGYKWVKEPVYLTIKVPVIHKHYDCGYDEYESGDFDGYLISLEEKRLFRIGSKRVKRPVYKKDKTPRVIKFKRYGE